MRTRRIRSGFQIGRLRVYWIPKHWRNKPFPYWYVRNWRSGWTLQSGPFEVFWYKSLRKLPEK